MLAPSLRRSRSAHAFCSLSLPMHSSSPLSSSSSLSLLSRPVPFSCILYHHLIASPLSLSPSLYASFPRTLPLILPLPPSCSPSIPRRLSVYCPDALFPCAATVAAGRCSTAARQRARAVFDQASSPILNLLYHHFSLVHTSRTRLCSSSAPWSSITISVQGSSSRATATREAVSGLHASFPSGFIVVRCVVAILLKYYIFTLFVVVRVS